MLLHRVVFQSSPLQDPRPRAVYSLSLHDALPISRLGPLEISRGTHGPADSSFGRSLEQPLGPTSSAMGSRARSRRPDRKSTRLNSSHPVTSYAVFCLTKKTTAARRTPYRRVS